MLVADTLKCLELMKLMNHRGLPWHPWAAVAVIENAPSPELPKIKWLVEHGCPLDGRAMYAAIRFKNLPLMEYIHALELQALEIFDLTEGSQASNLEQERQT